MLLQLTPKISQWTNGSYLVAALYLSWFGLYSCQPTNCIGAFTFFVYRHFAYCRFNSSKQFIENFNWWDSSEVLAIKMVCGQSSIVKKQRIICDCSCSYLVRWKTIESFNIGSVKSIVTWNKVEEQYFQQFQYFQHSQHILKEREPQYRCASIVESLRNWFPSKYWLKRCLNVQ